MNKSVEKGDGYLLPDQPSGAFAKKLPVPFFDRELLDPNAFSHPVEKIELIETHISWVILTGPFAYKIKKPVKLEFVDFSTIQRRHDYCLKELEVNSFFAPDLYLEVLPIVRQQGALRFGGPGEPIDWAVKMQQFPQSSLLINRLDPRTQDAIRSSHMDQLAHQMARYHGKAQIADQSDPRADVKNVFDPALENFDCLLEFVADPKTLDELKLLYAWTQAQIDARKQSFLARAQRGFIRACHGDLHLGNVLYLNHRFLVFDAIEFNESLRWIDTMNDLAFLIMELHDHDRHDLANRLLSQYLEESEDYSGLAVLPFYLVYRSMVRAKIEVIRAQQQGIVDLSNEGYNYVRHAIDYVASKQSKLWITHGFSGSGKSSAAMQHVENHGFIRLRSDVVRKKMFGLNPLDKPDHQQIEQLYSSESSKRTYQTMLEQSQTIIRCGYSPIVDATFLNQEYRNRFQQLAGRLGAEYGIVDCAKLDATELAERVSHRRRDPSDADARVIERQLAHHDPLDQSELKLVVGGPEI